MITLARATEARDELVEELGFLKGPHRGVIGIGIAREPSGYVLAVDVTRDDVPLPKDVHGVPVRVVVSAVPKPYSAAARRPRRVSQAT